MTLRIEAPHFTAGVILESEVCIQSAPIIKYMVGWTLNKILAYCDKRDWRYKFI